MERRTYLWPQLLTESRKGFAFGGDYNPDQWPETVWDEDIELMCQAGVTMVSLAIFSWAKLQPAPDEWNFGWLDTVIAKLGAAGIAVDLASATATAPLWLYELHPEILPRGFKGEVINPGSRQSWRPTSPIFRTYALELCTQLARRYGSNPTVTAWHLGNEYGWNNYLDYSDDALAAFRQWCEKKYSTVEALNEAWGTAFWSQTVRSFDEVLLPRYFGITDAFVNPAQFMDFRRFSSDALKGFYEAERNTIERISPGKPLTTNFMVSTDQALLNYADWAKEVDFVSNDHYFKEGYLHLDELACSDSYVSALAEHKPWMLMENSTSAVNWKPVNARKRNGELIRDALAHVGGGSDGILFFQWRQSQAGAEAFHSSMLPHAGEDSRIFRDIEKLGGILKQLSQQGVDGSHAAPSRTGIIFDVDSQWALENKTLPATGINHWHDIRDWYRALLDNGTQADVVPLSSDWSDYQTLIVPNVFMLSHSAAQRIENYVHAGGHLIVTYASGIVDSAFHVGLGGYPAVLSKLVGIKAEEFNILGALEGEPTEISLSNGFTTNLWQNVVSHVEETTEVLATYSGSAAADWDIENIPAITKNSYGAGTVHYLGCNVSYSDLCSFIQKIGVGTQEKGKPEFLHLTRLNATQKFDFYFNRLKASSTFEVPPNTRVILNYRSTQESGSRWTVGRNGVLVTRASRNSVG